jgi:hypothetical protein
MRGSRLGSRKRSCSQSQQHIEYKAKFGAAISAAITIVAANLLLIFPMIFSNVEPTSGYSTIADLELHHLNKILGLL